MEFYEKFKTYSNSELLKIIENSNDYQSQAVETAKTVFSDRQLSEVEIKIAKDELELERQEKSRKEQQKKAVEDKIKNVSKSVFDQINPIQKKEPTSEKTIKIISILLGGFFLIQLYKEFGMLKYMFTYDTTGWDFSMVLYFFPLVVIPTATILFYMRKKEGWLLLTIFLTYSAVSAIGYVILALNWKPSGIESLDILNPQISPIKPILSFVFFVGMIWTISREKIRNIYSITKRTMILTVIITALIVGIGIMAL